MRIQSKFVVLFLTLSLVPFMLIGAIAYRNGRQAVEEHLGQLFELRASRAVEALDREFRGLQRSAQAWPRLELMQDVLADDIDGRISSFLIEQVRHNQLLSRAVVTNPAGQVVAASRPEWVGRTLSTTSATDACGDEPVAPGGLGASAVTCASPIRALFDEQRILGTLLVSCDLGELFRRTQQAQSLEPAAGELLFLRRDGLVIFAPHARQDWIRRLNLAAAGSQAALLAGAGQAGFRVETLARTDYLIGYAPSAGTLGWSALVIQDVGTAFAPVYRLRRIAVGVGAAVALSIVALSLALGRRAARPLLELAQAAERVAGGDLDVKVAVRTRDELGSLSESFNRMTQDLKLQRSQLVDKQYLDSILASMLDGLLVVDPRGMAVKLNGAMLELIGEREGRVLGHPAGSLFVEGEDAFRTTLLEPALAGRHVREVEMGLRHKRAGPVPTLLSAAAIPSREGSVAAVVCIATDITQRKFTERALVKAREDAEDAALAKAQFLATISHEIRTPLNGVIGMMDVLFGTPLSRAQRGFAETARRSGEALLAVVNDLLDFSKIDAGRLEIEAIDFDLRACLEAVGDVLALKAHEKGVELVVQVDPGLAERVYGDPARLRQVLLNLGSNAVKFTPRGEVVIRAASGRSDSQIRFAVSDTGIGIPPDRLGRLFRPFTQVDASTTRRYGGTGLGLAISKQIVELMKGEIDIESEPGRGSTFSFTAELPPAKPLSLAPQAALPMVRDLRVLIVDDNATNREVLREMLRVWGWTFAEAADAWEALERLKAAASTGRGFDLALIDFQMPEMDGGQLAAEIKNDPLLSGIPLVLVTSVPQHGDAARMMNLGFAAYLTKPIKQSVLHESIVTVMRARPDLGREGRPRLALVTAHTVSEATRARSRILVVDDVASSRDVATQLLRKAGYPCDVATNGQEALRAWQSGGYSLVFMDCQMPEMDGYEVTRRIRLHEAGGSRTPIVAMTGEVLAGDRERCLSAGMDDAIGKPVRGDDFRRMLERYLCPGAGSSDPEPDEPKARPISVPPPDPSRRP